MIYVVHAHVLLEAYLNYHIASRKKFVGQNFCQAQLSLYCSKFPRDKNFANAVRSPYPLCNLEHRRKKTHISLNEKGWQNEISSYTVVWAFSL